MSTLSREIFLPLTIINGKYLENRTKSINFALSNEGMTSLTTPDTIMKDLTYDAILEALGEKKKSVAEMTPTERIQHYYRQYTKANNGKTPCLETSEELAKAVA